jgi:hypothetical protein
MIMANGLLLWHLRSSKRRLRLLLGEGIAGYQLVGGVKAYQGYDV